MIPLDAALTLQLAAICGNEPSTSYIEVRPLRLDGRPAPRARVFIPVGECNRVGARNLALAPRLNVFIGAAPRTREDGTADAIKRVWCLWADVDTSEALTALRAFRPTPSIVVRSGSGENVHAYWPLREAISPEWARRANRRLALALRADIAATDAARVLRPVGSLNHKHTPPVPVTCSRLELDMFTMAEVVGGLRDSAEYNSQPRRELACSRDGATALDGLARTVRDAQQGNRNNALHWAACRARERAAAGEMDASSARCALRDAALVAGLGEHEIEATLHSALDARVT